MDPLGGSASASLVSTLQQELEHCISFHTDAGMEKDSENPRHKFNKELLAEIGDSRMATIRMNKAFVGSRLIFSPNVHGWLKEEDAVKVGGKVIDSGLGDCDLCAAAAVRDSAMRKAFGPESRGVRHGRARLHRDQPRQFRKRRQPEHVGSRLLDRGCLEP